MLALPVEMYLINVTNVNKFSTLYNSLTNIDSFYILLFADIK